MQPMVSVRVITYNHEKYLRDCLEGILMQKTSFPFEVIVGEDCSTDGTRAIAAEYAARYPDIVRLIISEKNVGPHANSKRVFEACRGKYQAYCEGDDYWIDPRKLQKQVDFLETHPEYSMCFHDAFVVSDNKNRRPKYLCPRDLQETLGIEDFLVRVAVPTAAIVARKTALDDIPEWRSKVWCSDLVSKLWSAHKGKVRFFDETMSVYRNNPTGFCAVSTRDHKTAHKQQLYAYSQFDVSTEYRYSALIGKRIQTINTDYRTSLLRKRLGLFYYVLRPDKAIQIIWRAVASR